ncbi:hypothetical protein HMPREF0091_10822 [Fannyhessea vaginae DSM 15829]|uniref:Uncharacterized protein n=1 Tax=Fannyhessea vaginae DSM 15829 TaxID=525256 RepID=F1T5E4_9ACTN|nr:hypothetical protein HMPREF0091_10822 [Fannyhessea vaginae DSM 15829]
MKTTIRLVKNVHSTARSYLAMRLYKKSSFPLLTLPQVLE